jgi:hypothetical protein
MTTCDWLSENNLVDRVRRGFAAVTGACTNDFGERYLIVTDYDRQTTGHILLPWRREEADALIEELGCDLPNLF